MAFTGETPGEFWLGRLHRECGSARGKQFEVEWYDTSKDSKAWALEDDGLDIMRAARVLVERIHLQPTETEGHFALTEESEEEIMAALAERQLTGTWDDSDDDNMVCVLCSDKDADVDDGIICDT